MIEKWNKTIWSDEYLISNRGNVMSLKCKRKKILKPGKNGTGYMVVVFMINGVRKSLSVHRLVAESFLGIKNELQVNHKDKNKSNNCLNNLEYVTATENIHHRFGIKRGTPKNEIAKYYREKWFNKDPEHAKNINREKARRFRERVRNTK